MFGVGFSAVLIFNEGTEGNIPLVVDEQGGLGLRVHDDLVDLREDVLFGRAAEVVPARLLGLDHIPRGVVPRLVGLIFVALALLLALDDHEVALDLLLELGGDIGLIYFLRGVFVLDAAEEGIVLLLLVNGLELVLEGLPVVVGRFVALEDAGVLVVGGEDLGEAAVVGLAAGRDPMLFVLFEEGQHEMLAHAVWLF